MANDTVDRGLIIEYSALLHKKAQQIRARTRPYVQIKKMKGDIWAYDGLNEVEAREVFGRNQSTTFSEIEHTRRKIARRKFEITLPIDGSDIRGLMMDPQGAYVQACVRAMERQFDRVVVESAFSDVLTGRDFDTTTTFASEGSTVDATGGATYEKILETDQNFIDNEVGVDIPRPKALLISGDEHNAFMKETELISGDFSRQFAVDKGQLVRALGFEVITYGGAVGNPILSVSGGVRDCVALAQGGICVGISKEASISIKDRPDLVETKQVQIIFELGAVRTEGVLVQKFQTTD